jgi:hypothetical protein
MTFDIHQNIFDADGLPLERVARAYQNELVGLFKQSPEGQALREEGLHGRWPAIMLDLGQSYLGITPPKMSAKDIREILFDLIPLKISAIAEQAPEIIRELQAFWSFLQREFHLANADACLAVFNDEATQRLKEEMRNPDNFGMAKAFIMAGLERGFDMQTQEGIDEWMRTYNAELVAGKGKPINLAGWKKQMGFGGVAQHIHILGAPEEDEVDDVDADITDEPDEDLFDWVSRPYPRVASQSSRKASTKQRSKMAKASRKKNRKRK